jgi:HK97 family phage portal protein
MRSGLRQAMRNLASAPAPVPYTGRGNITLMSALSNPVGLETYMRTYGLNSTVHAVVSLLAVSTAKPEWRLYRKTTDNRVRYSTGDSGPDQRTEVLKHQALQVWQRPNPFMTQTRLTEQCQTHMELTGEQYQLVTYAGNIPVGLWPARPDRMTPVPSRTEFLAGWVYTGPDGEKIPFKPNEVLQTVYPNPFDPYRGLGPVQSALTDIEASRYSAEWNRNFFLNAAEPGGVLEVPTDLDEAQFDELDARWRETHQGVTRAHRVALLENGVTWKQTQITQRDMEFGNLRTLSRDLILSAWGIHKVMIGIADDVNRANAITAEEVFQDSKVTTRLDRIKDTLNFQYLPLFGATGEGVEFDYINPRPVNREADALELQAKAQAALWLTQAGYDPDDVCTTVGLPPMEVLTPDPLPEPPGQPALDGPAMEQTDMTGRLRKVMANGHLPLPAGRW